LEGNFGRCGAISERFGVVHTCYAQQYRFCQPLARSPVLSVPGWYRCVDSLATKLLLTPELKTTAALAQASGQIDALQTPAAALTMFAPTDVGLAPLGGQTGVRAAQSGSVANSKRAIHPAVRAHRPRSQAFA
jgi:hypothetical protein